MTTEATAEVPQPVEIRERIGRKALRPLMSNFSSTAEALFELVDNAFDGYVEYYKRHDLEIRVDVTKDFVAVTNKGGKGMGEEELQQWLHWGQSIGPTDGIHEYGQGGKAAMGYIGNAWQVESKLVDQPWLWKLRESDWANTESEERSYTAQASQAPSELSNLGYFSVRITKLHPRRQNLKKLEEQLGNIYRTLLLEGKVKIFLNDEPIIPLAIPLYEGYKIVKFNEKSPFGWWVKGWIGRLKRDARSQVKIKGGMRVTRARRLVVEGEYFGHPGAGHKQSLNSLIGEVELTKVPVLPNKTNFDRDSNEWVGCSEVLNSVLEPHIRDLLNQREEQTVSKEERKRVQDVRDKMIMAIKDSVADGNTPLPQMTAGRNPPNPQTPPRKPVENPRGPHGPNSPRTVPPSNARGRLKRLAGMPPWRIDVLDPGMRSAWRDENKQRALIINKTFPLYEEWKGDELYIAETAALELVKPEGDEKRSIEEYIEEVNSLISSFCQVLNS